MYVASVLSGCCICCTGYTRMLQVYVSNVSAVSNVCCKCFIWMLHMLQCHTHMLHANVVNVSFVSGVCCNVSWQSRQRGAGEGGPLGRSGPHIRAGSEVGVTAGAEHKVVSMGVVAARSTKLYPWTGSRRGARGKRGTKLHPWTCSMCGATSCIHRRPEDIIIENRRAASASVRTLVSP